jgi:biopolymer transport protein ExbB/TolQ
MKSVLSRDDTRPSMESSVGEWRPRRFRTRPAGESVPCQEGAIADLCVPVADESNGAAPARGSASQRIARLFEQTCKGTQDPYKYFLCLRFALLNLVGFALLSAAYFQGLVGVVIKADSTYLSVLIFLVFLVGLGVCSHKVWQTSRELNSVREAGPRDGSSVARYLAPLMRRDAESRANLAGALRLRLSHRIAIVRHIGNTLVLLGLIGTVLGFIISLSGVDPERASDISTIAPMVSTLIRGMSTALYTTLVGSVLNVWLMANHQLLAGGTVKLMAALVERAEEHA